MTSHGILPTDEIDWSSASANMCETCAFRSRPSRSRASAAAMTRSEELSG